MAVVSNVTVATSWTPVPISANAPVTLWNAADEAITVRFGGAGATRDIAAGEGLRVRRDVAVEAQCASGGKTLQVLVGVTPEG